MTRFRAWRARRRHDRHLRWLRTRKVILPPPHHTTARNGPQAVCGGVAAVLFAVLAAPPAHAEAFATISEPSTLSLMGLGALAFALHGVGRYNAHRCRDPRMSRRHPGRQCNCLACVDAYPDH